MSDAARLQALRDFGFSPYASRAYLALLDLGPTDARSISREARVPAPKVYATLNLLMEKGLVRLILGTPRRYEPIPFGEYLGQQKSAHLEEAQRLALLAPTLEPLFGVAPRKATSDRGTFTVLRGRQPILRRQRQLAAGARHDVLVVPSDGAIARMPSLAAILGDASAHGVRPRLLVPPGALSPERRRTLGELAEVRIHPSAHTSSHAVSYAVFDRTHAVLVHHVPDDTDIQAGHDVAIHVSETAIAQSLHDLLETRWLAASPRKPARKAARRRSG